MELHLILDGGAVTLNDNMWLENSSSPPYQELSSNQDSIVATMSRQQATISINGYHSPAGPMINWDEKTESQNYSPDATNTRTITTTTTTAAAAATTTTTNGLIRSNSSSPQQYHQSLSTSILIQNDRQQLLNTLKRRSSPDADSNVQQQFNDIHGRKMVKKDGSVNNDSGQGWSSNQVEDLAEHFVTDFDGSLSALAATDLATAVASYNNMSEALLGLPSLTVFKQEAPSPDNHHGNQSLNHVSQQRGIIGGATSAATNATVVGVMEADSNNNNNHNNNGGSSAVAAASATASASVAANLHHLLYSNENDYPTGSNLANQVSSSQQGNECNEDYRFQYVLAAATSIATKINEETLTYLNQGQSYEIKLKKLGDLSAYRGKMLKSSIRICFHERRLQYTEREQMIAWQRTRPGERLLEVDVPLSYGTIDVRQPTPSSNVVEFMWDPTKEVGVYIKVNCISTEFTPKKHGGEKGVPFRIQVETRIAGGSRLHAASCQVKVFKLKGADRKHKQDRDKVLRRPSHEQDKYQPSYDCTVLSDIPLDCLTSHLSPESQIDGNSFAATEATNNPQTRGTMGGSSSPVNGPIPVSVTSSGLLPIISNPETIKESTMSPTGSSVPSPVTILPEQSCAEINPSIITSMQRSLSPEANANQTSSWLRAGRFQAFESTFASFSASDILRLSRDDLIQICGLADGIRLFNALHSKPPTPRLTLYFSTEGGGSLWRAIYLETLTSNSLLKKLHAALGAPGSQQDRLHSILILGPQGIHVLVTDDLVANMRDESMFIVETIRDTNSDRYKILLKPSSR